MHILLEGSECGDWGTLLLPGSKKLVKASQPEEFSCQGLFSRWRGDLKQRQGLNIKHFGERGVCLTAESMSGNCAQRWFPGC